MDTDTIDKELANPNFDPILFVNSILPDESSLEQIEMVRQQLIYRSKHISHSIKEAVHSYSVLGDRSDAILSETKNSIDSLAKRIIKIHDLAKNTESVVGNICGGIKPLDRAKRNLTISRTTLEKLQQMQYGIKELSHCIDTRDYSQCAEHLNSLKELFHYFRNYDTYPQILPLYSKFHDQQQQLKSMVNSEFDSLFLKDTIDSSNHPVCFVVDALEERFKEQVLRTFCTKSLQMYDDTYKDSDLSQLKNRVIWYKQFIVMYNKKKKDGFPDQWRMQYQITRKFCEITKVHIQMGLSTKEPSLDSYLSSFKIVVKFEKKMANFFSTTVDVPFDPNTKMPEFPLDAEGVKAKYDWLQRQKERRPEKKIVEAKEFIGSIASAFTPYLNLYLNNERDRITKIISDGLSDIKKEIDPEDHMFHSATNIVFAMNETIDECAGFGVPQSLLDLFMVLKELLGYYISSLTKQIPKKSTKDWQYQVNCCAANTSSYFLSIVDSLSKKVGEKVGDELKPGIIVDDVKDLIGAELKTQLISLADSFIKENDTFLIQIGNNSWKVEDSERIPNKLKSSFEIKFKIIQAWLSNENMNRIRPQFCQKLVSIIRDSLFKSKFISVEDASGISTAIKDLKSVVIDWTKADSSSSVKRVNAEFSSIENELTIVISPEIAMAQVYITKFKQHNREHFLTLVKLKGLKGQDEIDAIRAFDDEIAALKK